jgi:hypothetical protein
MEAVVKTDKNKKLSLDCDYVSGKIVTFTIPSSSDDLKIHDVGIIDPIRYSMAIQCKSSLV